MTHKHTLGPWAYYSADVGDLFPCRVETVNNAHTHVADCGIANARLIVAAPDLYKLVKEYRQSVATRKNMADADNNTLLVDALLDRLDKIDAVLAKVEGDDA